MATTIVTGTAVTSSLASTGSFGSLRIKDATTGANLYTNAYGLTIDGSSAGYYPLTVTSAYETAARFLSSDGTAAIEIADNSSTTGYNRIQVIGNDRMEFYVNNVEMLEIAASNVVFNQNSADINFRVEGNNDPNLFTIDAGLDHIGIGKSIGNTGDEKLLVAGNVGITGSLHVSGNISTSGSVIAREFKTEYVTQTITQASGSTQWGDSGDDTHEFTGSVHVSGTLHISSSTNTPAIQLHASASNDRIVIQTDEYGAILWQTKEHSGDNHGGKLIEQTWTATTGDVIHIRGGGAGDNVSQHNLGQDIYTLSAQGDTATEYVRLYREGVSGSINSTGSFGHLELGRKASNFASAAPNSRIATDGAIMAGLMSYDTNYYNHGYHTVVNKSNSTQLHHYGYYGHTFSTQGKDEAMVVSRSGNVGIGNVIPTEALVVEGSVSASLTGSFGHLEIGDAIASAYLDADTAHLSTTQTFTGAKTFGTQTWNGHIAWNNGININTGGECSFDMSSGDQWGVWDGNFTIKSIYGAQVRIGESGNRGLAVYGPLTTTGNVSGSITSTGSFGCLVIPENSFNRGFTIGNHAGKARMIYTAGYFQFTDADDSYGSIAAESGSFYGDVGIKAAKKLYFDDGEPPVAGHTYISEVSDDLLEIWVGATRMLKFEEGGTDYVYTPDNVQLGVGSSKDLMMYHNGTNSYINNTTGDLHISSSTSDKDIRFSVNDGGSVKDFMYMDSSNMTLQMLNSTISGVNLLQFNDPGSGEGISWSGGSWAVFVCPDDMSNAAGNLQFVSGSAGAGRTNGHIAMRGMSENTLSTAPNIRTQLYMPSSSLEIGNVLGANVANAARVNIVSEGNERTLQLTANNDGTNGARSVSMLYHGYEGRAAGAYYTDQTYTGKEWFVGTPYNNSGTLFQIGYDDGGLSEYVPSASIAITANDSVAIGNSVTSYDLDVYGNISNSTGIFQSDDASTDLKLRRGTNDDDIIKIEASQTRIVGDTVTRCIFTSAGIKIQNDGDAGGTGGYGFWTGAGDDLHITHDGTNSHIVNKTGNLHISQSVSNGNIEFSTNDAGNIETPITIQGSTGNILIAQPSKLTFANGQTIYDNGGGGLAIKSPTYDLDLYAGTDDGGDMNFYRNGTTIAMIIDNDGTITQYGSVNISGALTSNYGAVFNETANDSDTRMESQNNANMFRLDAGNDRIGIGTGSPGTTLEVIGSISSSLTSTGSFGEVRSAGNVRIPAGKYLYLDGDGNNTYIREQSNGIVQHFVDNENLLELTSAGSDPRVSRFNQSNYDRDFSFCGDTNADVLYFDASAERVGIGTASPSATLEVNGTSNFTGIVYIDHGGSDYSPNLSFLGGTNTPGSNAYENAGIGYYDNAGTGNMKFFGNRGAMNWIFTDADETLFLMSSAGDFHCEADVVAYSTSTNSDRTLKENINPIPYGLNEVLKMNPVEYDWKEKRNKAHDIGVIAQELEKIIPEVVQENKDLNSDKMIKSVDYGKMVAVLIKAIQQQQEEIELLKSNYSDLKLK